MAKAVEVRGLTKRFGDLEAVKGVSFDIERGAIFSLLGPNGAGKTTTIKMLSTLLKPTSGDALIEGVSVVRDPVGVRRVIGLVPQDLTADDEMTGWYNVYLQARLHGYGRSEAEERARRALEMVDLARAAGRKVSTYSGGMRRRLEIAMSLVHEPKVLFLDEPTLGLDVQGRRALWEKIMELRGMGVTILLTTHYMEEAEYLSDRVAIIDGGEIKAEGSPEELKSSIRGERVYVEFYSMEDAEGVLGRISRELGVEASADGSSVYFTVQRSETVLPRLISVLAGMRVRAINIVRPNLEEVFLELTGKRLVEEGEAMDAFKYRVFLRKRV